MRVLTITSIIHVYQFEELGADDKTLLQTAMEATRRSYSPYSRFAVGAAVLLADGTVVTGSNQENAAYPSGLCAERTTLFYANSQYPDQPVQTLAIAARTEEGFVNDPIPPCGACRQVILETEKRYNQHIRILLYGLKGIYEIQSIGDLLPLSFEASAMDPTTR
ncbi:MAG: cytidine deaminase [Mediterranea sp.]|jgi:cytidine deaminase|nr:cytidine deaminase [Mediterranea sp.]